MIRKPVLATNDDLPVRTEQPVHSGKVRAVYWLTAEDSARLIAQREYPVAPDAELAIMVISDRLSAFDCIWRGEAGLAGVPGKGAALNAVSKHWFDTFAGAGLARSHILEMPHPMVWVVQRARPVMIEAIARRYITGSMWRAYATGERDFCGWRLPAGLQRDQRLDSLLITPSTKGVLQGIPDVPAVDDTNISRQILAAHWDAFGFARLSDVGAYENLLRTGFELIEQRLSDAGYLFVDTKFEFGYARDRDGAEELIYMDEVGTPDSSRIWDAAAYASGHIVDSSKEAFRQALLDWVPDDRLLLDKERMSERLQFARDNELPAWMLEELGERYRQFAAHILGQPIAVGDAPREEIIAALDDELGLI